LNKFFMEIPDPLTQEGVEKLRLILSTYQDGTGMLASSNGMTLPGWRDFERAVAAALDGKAQESKYVFDVIITKPEYTFGISCKMRGELNKVADRDDRAGRVTIELSNSAKKFWGYLKTKGITEANYREQPTEVGIALIELVQSWHKVESILSGGRIHLDKSSYLALSWNKKGSYQLHQFALMLPDARTLRWYFPMKKGKKGEEPANRLCGDDVSGTLFEWYGTSGGQLKYYPLAQDALWASDIFHLEPLPSSQDIQYGIVAKTKAYYPLQWDTIERENL